MTLSTVPPAPRWQPRLVAAPAGQVADGQVAGDPRLERLLQAVGALSWSLDPCTLRILDVDGDVRAVLGRSAGALLGSDAGWLAVAHPDDRAHVGRALASLPADGGNLVHRTIADECSVRWLRSVVDPTVDPSGTVVRIDGVTTDVTERIEREAQLRGTVGFLHRISEVTGVGGWEIDLDTGQAAWTPTTRRILGAPADHEPSPRELRDTLVPGEHRDRLLAAVGRCVAVGAPWDLEVEVQTCGGVRRWVRVLGRGVRDEPGDGPAPRVRRLEGAVQDIDAQVRATRDLAASEERLKLVLRGSDDGWWDWDLDAGTVFYSPRWYGMLGYAPGELPATPELLLELLHPEDRPRVETTLTAALTGELETYEIEFRLRHKDGHDVPVRSRGFVRRDPEPSRIAGTNVDLTAQKRAEARQAALYRDLQRANVELQRQATVDGLTEVANRRRFDTVLEQVWQRACGDHLPISLLLCDVDHFKVYNDHHGHPAGDRALIAVAAVIRGAVRGAGDLVARYGGEEFAVLLPGTGSVEAQRIAQRIRDDLDALALPHPHSPVRGQVTLCIGVASLRPTPGSWSQTLITRADDALLRAKRDGRDRIVLAGAGDGPSGSRGAS